MDNKPELFQKQYLAKSIDIDEDERTVTAVISTDIVDREREVLLPAGAQFDHYLKNPVVLWAHDYKQPPIGRAVWVKKGRGRITAKTKFADSDKAEEVYQLFKGGFLKAFSVGFAPLDSHQPTPEEIKKKPDWANAVRVYDKWDMWEFSAVPVPANPEALVMAIKSKDVSVSEGLIDELGLDIEEEVYVADGPYVKVHTKPEETEDYIRIPVRECKITATITISASQGIKALYCGGDKKVATYLFAKAKGWTMDKAKAWVKEHGNKSEKELEANVIDVKLIQPIQVKAFEPPKIIRCHPIVSLREIGDEQIKQMKGIMF